MPSLGVHDPLALQLVDNATILAARDERAERDIELDAGVTVRCSAAELYRLRQIIDTWDINGSSVLPFESVEGSVYYLDKQLFESIYNSIVTLKNSRYARLFNFAKALIDQNNATADVTARDISDEQWPAWDSNLVFDPGAVFTYAQWSPTRKHAGVTIAGTYNHEASTGEASHVTAVADQPVYRSSYFEFDITGNTGELYVGLIDASKAVSAAYQLGSDASSIGIRIDGTTVKDAMENGVVIPLVDMDAAVGNAPVPAAPNYVDWTANRIGLRYDPHNGRLEVSIQEDQVPYGDEWQLVASNLNYRLGGVGAVYPAVSIKTGSAVKLIARSAAIANYGGGYAPANALLNMAKGLFVVDESA